MGSVVPDDRKSAEKSDLSWWGWHSDTPAAGPRKKNNKPRNVRSANRNRNNPDNRNNNIGFRLALWVPKMGACGWRITTS